MEKKIPIKLPKLLYDVSREKALHPNNLNVTQEERDEAWARVANINGLSLHETRSIFKVLLKKYEQEKDRPGTSWKLFSLMDNIHKAQMKSESSDNYDDENEEFEMLEVQEEDDIGNSPEKLTGKNSLNDCDMSSRSSNSFESVDKQNVHNKSKTATPPREERKVLNSLVSSAVRNSPAVIISQQKNTSSISIKPQTILQHRGITLKKATPSSSPKIPMSTYAASEKKEKTTIQLPEAFKRKLNENLAKDNNKKIHLSNSTSYKTARQASPVAQAPAPAPARVPTPKLVPQPVTIKTEIEEDLIPGTVITLPNNGTNSTTTAAAAAAATTTTTNKNNNNNIQQTGNASNGFAATLKDIDFSKDIIFDNHVNDINCSSKNTPITAIKLENDYQSEELTPTFFKNLCNSSRHEAFGLYVANIMNRLSKTAAAKLEIQILRSVTNILSEDMTS